MKYNDWRQGVKIFSQKKVYIIYFVFVVAVFFYILRPDNSTFYHREAALQQIGIGISFHQATRNENVIDFLSSFKITIPHQLVVRIAIADAVKVKSK